MANDNVPKPVDLNEAARLIDALERDLAKVRGGSADVQRLRDEVEALRKLLDAPAPEQHWIADRLHDLRDLLDATVDEAVYEGVTITRYAAELARMLGL
jgi:hypothetical protein